MKRIKTSTLLLLVLVLLLTSGCQRTETIETKSDRPAPSSKIISSKTETKLEKKPIAIIPNRLWIPSIGLMAPVKPVGLLKNGQLEVPKSSEVAGVFIEGVLPGQPGNAIIAGHVDNYKGPAIFYPLKKLKPEDPVLLSDEVGNYLVFRVVAVESYPTAKAPLEKIFGDTNQSQLNLITCTGKYNRKKKEHEKRLVVYTRLIK
ncbi:class F sortase [Paenibacillus durus]|uniref:Peptidase C60 sortase A and B n=1 Tax=Paenibacillus durus ATCC 35681 TaxID=1333534 RepID=A0A0F7CHU2_PAEDU|nr:class F sortase [Paenibacillus durus]AKG34776.1 peptidase C60 sortase A and B [Paenibacillus durus ATCC 35681]